MDHTQEQMDGMSDAELRQLAQQTPYAAPPGMNQVAVAPSAPAVAPPVVEQAPAQPVAQPPAPVTPEAAPVAAPVPQAPAEVDPAHDGRTEALRQARAAEYASRQAAETYKQQVEGLAKEKAALEQRQAQIEAALQDRSKVQAHLQTLPGAEAPDIDTDPAGHFAHLVAPMKAELAQVKQQLAQTQQEATQAKQEQAQRVAQDAHLTDLQSKHGGDVRGDLSTYDQANPGHSNVPAEYRLIAARHFKAQQAASPEAQAAAVAAQVAQQTKDQLAAILAGGGKGIPTLGSAPQSFQEGGGVNLDTLNHGTMESMTPEALKAAVRASYGK